MKDVVETEKKKKMALEKVKYELVKMEVNTQIWEILSFFVRLK